MDAIRWKLVEAGVIGGVVDDFNPRLALNVFYGDKRVSLGTQVSPHEVQDKPHRLHHPRHPEVLLFPNPTLTTVVMTNPDAPGSEYLHWIYTHSNAGEGGLGLCEGELVIYEPPRLMGSGNIVFTVFKPNEALPNIILPASRENFSTRAFADTNALGPPVAAAFFRINHHENGRLPTCNGHVG